MNGIVSHNMRTQGADYKINFGLTLPLLKRIAAETTPDAQLAEALWADTAVRESMMLAPMVYPIEEFDEAEADRWLDTMPNTEVADICCKYLFCRRPFAIQKANRWSRSDIALQQYTAFQLATAWLIAHPRQTRSIGSHPRHRECHGPSRRPSRQPGIRSRQPAETGHAQRPIGHPHTVVAANPNRRQRKSPAPARRTDRRAGIVPRIFGPRFSLILFCLYDKNR